MLALCHDMYVYLLYIFHKFGHVKGKRTHEIYVYISPFTYDTYAWNVLHNLPYSAQHISAYMPHGNAYVLRHASLNNGTNVKKRTPVSS